MFVTVLVWIINFHAVYADILIDFQDNRGLEGKNLSVIKPEKWLNLEKLKFNYLQQAQTTNITEEKLLKLSKRLRDIARYLGSKWPIIVSVELSEITQDHNSEKIFTITDILQIDGTVNSITVGQALKLVTEELEILKNSKKQPLIDFLIKDENSGTYKILNRVSLKFYCEQLLTELNI